MKKIIVIALSLLSISIFAQVNTEAYRKQIAVSGFSGGLSTYYNLDKGNQDSIKLGLGGQLQYVVLGEKGAEPLHHLFLISDNAVAKRDGTLFDNQNFLHARWTYMWGDFVGNEVYTQYQYNDFKNLDIRKIAGTGFRFVLFKREFYAFYFGTSYLYEYERYNYGSILTTEKNHRWSNYASVKLGKKDDFAQFNLTAYYQPRFDQFSDFRLICDAGLFLSFNKWFGYEIGFNLRYDNDPLEGSDKNDYSFKNKLRFSF